MHSIQYQKELITTVQYLPTPQGRFNMNGWQGNWQAKCVRYDKYLHKAYV
jgi:hypothetical protein